MQRTPLVLCLIASVAIGTIATFEAATRRTLYPTPAAAALAGWPDERDGDAVEIATTSLGAKSLVVTAAPRGKRRLAVALVTKQGSGWYIEARAESEAGLEDVGHGSLLVAELGEPPTVSVVFGELRDPAVQGVEILWNDEIKTKVSRTGDGYIAARRRTPKAERITFLNSLDEEISFVDPNL